VSSTSWHTEKKNTQNLIPPLVPLFLLKRMEFDGDLDIKARAIEDLKRTPEELTRQAAMRWADGQIDPMLPSPPFFLQIVGGIGKGKTTIILNMLREYQKYNTFCRVIYLSPSGTNDAKLRMFLTADNSNFEYTEENLTKIIREIEEENAELKGSSSSMGKGSATPATGSNGLTPEEIKRRVQGKVPKDFAKGKSAALSGLANIKSATKTKEDLAKDALKKVSCRTLIIADDATGSILTARNSPFVKFLVSIRHQDASVILCTHSETSLSAQLRNIVTGVILFEPGTGRELKSIVDDVGGVSQNTLVNVLAHVQRVPHGFVFIDKKRPFRDRFVLNFKNVMDPDAFANDGLKKGSPAEKELSLFRSGGFMPTPAQATATEAKFAKKAYALQLEAALLNRGLTPADKILKEQNDSANRKRRLESSASTDTVKRAKNALTFKSAQLAVQRTSEKITPAKRAAAFRVSSAANLTGPSRSVGAGALDARVSRGINTNVAIATGGRRGVGGRGRRGAAALGPLAQQLEENILLQQQLKTEKDQLGKDEAARKDEAANAEAARQLLYDGPAGPDISESMAEQRFLKANPPPLPTGSSSGRFLPNAVPTTALNAEIASRSKEVQGRLAQGRDLAFQRQFVEVGREVFKQAAQVGDLRLNGEATQDVDMNPLGGLSESAAAVNAKRAQAEQEKTAAGEAEALAKLRKEEEDERTFVVKNQVEMGGTEEPEDVNEDKLPPPPPPINEVEDVEMKSDSSSLAPPNNTAQQGGQLNAPGNPGPSNLTSAFGSSSAPTPTSPFVAPAKIPVLKKEKLGKLTKKGEAGIAVDLNKITPADLTGAPPAQSVTAKQELQERRRLRQAAAAEREIERKKRADEETLKRLQEVGAAEAFKPREKLKTAPAVVIPPKTVKPFNPTIEGGVGKKKNPSKKETKKERKANKKERKKLLSQGQADYQTLVTSGTSLSKRAKADVPMAIVPDAVSGLTDAQRGLLPVPMRQTGRRRPNDGESQDSKPAKKIRFRDLTEGLNEVNPDYME